VALSRQLAGQRPTVFLPDLAGSLINLGDRLNHLERREEALKAAEEAVRALAPCLHRHPGAFTTLMSICAGDYRRYAEALGETPDEELLRPIVEVMASAEAELAARAKSTAAP
jgi:hypothetical protein